MKSNVPWSVKGIDPEARVVAKDAARKAGMTLGEWMNQMIREMGEERSDGAGAEGAPADAPAPVSGVSTEQLRAVVDSLNRLNERLKTTEDGLKTSQERQRQVAGDLGQGLETVFERMKRIERERREGTPDALATRVDALERGEGDRGRIEGLKKLESALTGMVEALEVTRAEALDKIEENEAAVQALATRVETLDDRLTQGFAEVHDAIDAVGQHLDRTERTAQAVIQDAKEAAASTDADFVEATSKRLMILGTEIKRSGDQIRTVEEMVTRLSDKIEAAEHRSAEGIGEVATSLEALRQDVLGEEDGADASSLGEGLADRESLAEAAREADKKVSRLQRSYESMMARLEGRPLPEGEADALLAETDGETGARMGAEPAVEADTEADTATDADGTGAAAGEDAPAAPGAQMRPAPQDPVINDTLAAGLGLAPTAAAAPAPSPAASPAGSPADADAQDDDFDEVFGRPTDAAAMPLASMSASVSAPAEALPEAPAEGPAADDADAEPRADLARLTPRQKVLLAAKARKKRLDAERAEGEAVSADETGAATPRVGEADGQDGGDERDAEATAPLAADAAHGTERSGRFGARNVGFALLFLVVAAGVWFLLNPRGETPARDEVADAAPAETTTAGRLSGPDAAGAQAPAAASDPATPSARDLYEQGVAAYEAGRAEEAFALFLRAEGDSVPARMRVGFALLNGVGTEPNVSRARSYLLDAANVGNVASMHLLGNIAASEALGVNVADATDWFERAADRGNINSMYNLGYLLDPTEEQDIVPMADRDPARAYEWYALAAALGDTISATEAEEVGALLTPEARAAIDARVADWTPLALLPSVNDGLNPPEAVVE